MWSIRFLTGPLVGQTYSLKAGKNILGRAPHCDIVIPSQNISKEHTQIEVYNDKIIVSDMRSRNGTFINGVQIKSHKLTPSERIGLFDILAIIEKTAPGTLRIKMNQKKPTSHAPMPAYQDNLAYNHVDYPAAITSASPAVVAQATPLVDTQMPIQQDAANTVNANNLLSYFNKYINEVVLPGVYSILHFMEFKYVLGVFVTAFVILVTSLSTIPLMRILKSSIEKEAQNRAQTIARTLARENRGAIMQGQLSLVSTENADREAGATAYIISNLNGDILAPPRLAGQYLTNIDFVNEAKKSSQESVKQIKSDTIVAVAPIRYYDPATGSESTAAHAVVVYNMGALAVDDGRTLSLFIQILFIATLLGGLLFFFMYKVILEPITNLNNQLNLALRETGRSSQINATYRFPELQALMANINSLISRGDGNFAGNNLQSFEVDRTPEMQNIVNLVGFPAITVRANDRTISSENEHFISQVATTGSWIHLPVDKISDQALKLNIQNLLERVVAEPSKLVTDQLEIANQNFDISAQGILGPKELAYVLIVFVQRGGA